MDLMNTPMSRVSCPVCKDIEIAMGEVYFRPPQPQMVGFCDLSGTDFAPVSNKTAVKVNPIYFGFIRTANLHLVMVIWF